MQPQPGLQTYPPQPVSVTTTGAAPVQTTGQERYGGTYRALVGLGIAQLLIGIACIAAQIPGFTEDVVHLQSGPGIWCGVMFIIPGVFGIIAGVTRHKGWLITFMIMSIVATLFALSLLIAASLAETFYSLYYYGDPSAEAAAISLIILSVLEGVIAIVSSAFSCVPLCTGTTYSGHVQTTTLVYQGYPQQQGMVINQGQPIQLGYPQPGTVIVQGGAPPQYHVNPAFPQQGQPGVYPAQPNQATPGYTAPPPYAQGQQSAPTENEYTGLVKY